MSDFLNQLLGGLAGGGRGIETMNGQRDKDAQAAALNEDRQAQAQQRRSQAQHEALLSSPEFQRDFQLANAGDEGAKARVASMVVNHPNGGAIMQMLNREPKAWAPSTLDEYQRAHGVGQYAKPSEPLMGSKEWKDAERFKAGLLPHPEPLKEVEGSDGRVTYVPLSQAAGMMAPRKAQGGGGFGALSPDIVQGMFDQAQHAHDEMTAFEEKYRKNHNMLGVASQTLGAATGAHSTGVMAPITGLEASLGNALLGVGNPEYQTYLAANKRFGNIMGNLMSKRYSEYQGTLDTQLAGLGAEDADPTIDLKQSYRTDLLKHRPNGSPSAVTAQPATAAPLPAPPAATREQQLWDAAVAKHGRKRVESLYGPRP